MLLSRESLILLDFVYWSFKVFKGNKDKDSIVYHEITPPIPLYQTQTHSMVWSYTIKDGAVWMFRYGKHYSELLININSCFKYLLTHVYFQLTNRSVDYFQILRDSGLTHKYYRGIAIGCKKEVLNLGNFCRWNWGERMWMCSWLTKDVQEAIDFDGPNIWFL